MPQNPIPAQAFARSPLNALKQLRCDDSGNIYVSDGPGNSWYVNETTGSDTTGDGSISAKFATLGAAKDVATANNGDTVYFEGKIHLSATLAWDKAGVSLIGLTAPSDNSRAQITVAAGVTQTQVTALHPLVNVTAQGCTFKNFGAFYGFNGTLNPPVASVAWAEAGGRNYYSNVQFLGGGDALMAILAGMRSITIAGEGENRFDDCTFGLDTVARLTAANATLEFLAGTGRNTFNRPIFQMLSTLSTNVHIKALTKTMDRYALFNDPVFINAVESTGTAIDQVASAAVDTGGAIILNRPCSLGATALATAGPVYIVGSSPVATTSGIAIKAT
jgi:hypothetical protein